MAKMAIDKGVEVDLSTGLSIEEQCYAQVNFMLGARKGKNACSIEQSQSAVALEGGGKVLRQEVQCHDVILLQERYPQTQKLVFVLQSLQNTGRFL